MYSFVFYKILEDAAGPYAQNSFERTEKNYTVHE